MGMRSVGKTWLPSTVWMAIAAASPWAARKAGTADPTIITLLAFFLMVGVLGTPLGIILGRKGALCEAVTTAGVATVVTTAVCVVLSYDAGVRWTPGEAFFTVLLAFLFAILALPLPAVGFVIGWVRRRNLR